MFGEPAPSQGDLNFVLFGIPVCVHPWFWLSAAILGYRAGDAAAVLIWIAAVFVCILIHELGHAFAMEAYGFRPWIVLHGFGGLTFRDQRYGFRSPRFESVGEILISLAGPAAGFLLAAVLALVIVMAHHGSQLIFIGPMRLMPYVFLDNPRLMECCNDVFIISVLWGMVNLLPVYPLDGGQVARELLLLLNPRGGIRQSLWLSIIVAAVMAYYGWTQWHSWFVPVFFGYLAYSNYQTLQMYDNHGRWY